MASTVPLAVMASFCKRLQSAEEAGMIVYRIGTHIEPNKPSGDGCVLENPVFY
ncbi:hypothetical protein PGT21_028627 [Puccinia graminis f. sp. tritici]|uniref:Uncharacterized protein n=1 Tax=Puccinia graminis f. sp. tritici TaxID=56615 RepID=A0A5B0N707_PUCGR|nr:hypothetical protein PGT21_028627 [Puccinia graminis f. sp. tritici]KAA1133010.1 hypothetical protein PGTUg99_022008 [Puccinia graminis f. sp. tritici]